MSPETYMNYNTQNTKYPNMHPNNENTQTMEQQHNCPRKKLHYRYYHSKDENESREWWKIFFIMTGKSTQYY